MEHFYENLDGWFDYQDIYRRMVEQAPDTATFVEVGSYMGRSAAFMAVEIANSHKRIAFTCVDIWTTHHVYANNSFERFTTNMEPASGYYQAVVGYSMDVAPRFADRSLDFVWIDADHAYLAVCNDIRTWLPKIKPGGWIGGHDYEVSDGGAGQAVRDMIGAVQLMPGTLNGNSSWLYRVA